MKDLKKYFVALLLQPFVAHASNVQEVSIGNSVSTIAIGSSSAETNISTTRANRINDNQQTTLIGEITNLTSGGNAEVNISHIDGDITGTNKQISIVKRVTNVSARKGDASVDIATAKTMGTSTKNVQIISAGNVNNVADQDATASINIGKHTSSNHGFQTQQIFTGDINNFAKRGKRSIVTIN